MKYLILLVPATLVITIYFVIYRSPLITDGLANPLAASNMLHLHIVFWWSAFLYLVQAAVFSFARNPSFKYLCASSLGISSASILMGFLSGFATAKQGWGVYFVWEAKFTFALLILFFTTVLFVFSLVVDKSKFLKIGFRIGLVSVVLIYFVSHFFGYYSPSQHPQSAIINILKS